MAKYQMVRDILAAEDLFEFAPSQLADIGVVKLAHDADYVDAFINGALPPALIRRIGFPWSEGLVNRTLASAGGTLAATTDALATGWGGNLAGGTHHAFRAEGSGFCVFNDIAIAIQWLKSEGRIRRAAVVDLDVHQGDGTASIFQDDPDVLTISVHCRVNFPFRKQRSKTDIELAEGIGDEEYLRTVHDVLPRALAFAPEIVFYQSGVDVLASDSLGRLNLTEAGAGERDRSVMQAAKSAGIPLVVTLGGGYSKPIELTARAHAQTFRIAAQTFG